MHASLFPAFPFTGLLPVLVRLKLNTMTAFRLLLPCFLVITVPTTAQGTEEQTQRQLAIIRTAMGSHIDEGMYRSFWDDMPDDLPREALIGQIEHHILLAQRYQRECWNSVRLSAQKGEIIRTKELDELAEQVTKVVGDTAEGKQALRNTDLLIRAAATKQAFEEGDQSFYVTEDMAEESLLKISAAIERVEILLGDEWPPKPKERQLESLGVKVLWAFPFSESQTTSELGGDATMKIVLAESVVDEDSVVSLARTSLSSIPHDLDATWKVLNEAVEGTAKGTGGTVVFRTRDTMRGMPCLAALVKVQDIDGDLFMSMKYAIDTKHSYMYQFAGLSTTMPRAEELRDSLVLSLHILNDTVAEQTTTQSPTSMEQARRFSEGTHRTSPDVRTMEEVRAIQRAEALARFERGHTPEELQMLRQGFLDARQTRADKSSIRDFRIPQSTLPSGFLATIEAGFGSENSLATISRAFRIPCGGFDPNFNLFALSDEKFKEITEGVAPAFFPAFDQAQSEEDAFRIRERILEIRENEQILANAGLGGFGARLLGAFLDPIRLAIVLIILVGIRRSWAVLVAAGLSALLMALFMIDNGTGRGFGAALFLGFVVGLVHAGLIYCTRIGCIQRRVRNGQRSGVGYRT